MQVILRENMRNLGKSGEIVTVKDGYGRNFLIPRGLATAATPRNVRELQHNQHVAKAQEEKSRKKISSAKEKLEQLTLNIAKVVGKEGKLFGAVTTREVAEVLATHGIEIDRKRIRIAEPIRALGVHSAQVNLGHDVEATIKIWVVSQ